MDTPYTQGFRAGMAWRETQIIELLKKRLCIFEQNVGNCQCSVCLMTKWHIALIKGEE